MVLLYLFAKSHIDESNFGHRRLATKDETSGILKSFITGIENLVDHKVKMIRCDNGTELKNKEMNQFCKMKGILRQFSLARTPQQNGVAERKNKTLIEAAITMLADSKLPTAFWAEAINTACYVQKKVLMLKPHNKTPYELFHGRTPTLSFMRPFGYPITILNTIDHLGKFDGKADECFFIGYSLNSKPLNLIVRSKFKAVIMQGKLGKRQNLSNGLHFVLHYYGMPISISQIHRAQLRLMLLEKQHAIELILFDLNMPALEDYSIFDFSRNDEDDGAEADMNNLDTTIQVSPIPTIRIHKDHPLDQVIGDLQSATQTRKMSKNLEEMGFEEPKKVIHALKDPSWIEAMQEELLQFKRDGYDEVFAPVARIEAIRLFLAYASFKDFVVYQMDVKSAFLYGKIEEEVYVCQPPGFEDPDFPDRVYKVEKALYGLHQAPRAWYETLSTYLLDNGFQRGKIDKTLFIKRHKGDILLVQVYVDDIIFGSTKKELCFAFEKLMHEKFQMSSMGELTFFLGLQVKQKKDGIFISQDKYVDEILKKFRFYKKFKDCKPHLWILKASSSWMKMVKKWIFICIGQ
ncbi:retrovirus-related pol polyprotein from transposon TNT 1-94 [Tanacetum coccineum]